MSRYTEIRGKRIYLYGGVEAADFKYPNIYFEVRAFKTQEEPYRITYNIEKWTFTDCTCLHGSSFGILKEEKCSHVEACREWVKHELKKYLETQRRKFLDLPPGTPPLARTTEG